MAVLRAMLGCALWSVAYAGLKDSANFPIGVAVPNGKVYQSQHGNTVKADFNEIVCENNMKMSYMHKSENTWSWSTADKVVNWANSAGIGVHGHVMVWHESYQLPWFMKSYSGDFESMLTTHCKTLGQHFAGRVGSWDVVNEALADSGSTYRTSVFYQKLGKSYLPKAFNAARSGDSSAELYYNDYNTEWSAPKFNRLLTLISDMKSAGAPLTGIGFQCHVSTSTSMSTMQSHFKQIADLGLKVKLTELDIGGATKSLYKTVVKTYLDAVPAALRGGITMWGLNDEESWRGASAKCLLFSNYQKKDAYYGFLEALTEGASSSSSSSSTPSPPSTPTPPSPASPSSGCSSAWGDCASSRCCVSGYSCSQVGQSYQCAPGSWFYLWYTSSSSSSSSCTSAWGNCMNTGCCANGYTCTTVYQNFKQCTK